MFRLVLFSVFIILRVEANVPETENPVIRLSYFDDRNENYVVWKDKPLKIIIENGSIRRVWCSNLYKRTDDFKSTTGNFVPETEFTNGDNHIILNISSVTADMSTRWACTALEEYHGPALSYKHANRDYTAKNLHFRLHVKGARAVILNANNQILTYVTTNLSDNYDGQTNYIYEDDEDFPMDFSCKIAEDKYNNDTLRLEYYNAEGNLLFQTKPRATTPHILRFALNTNNDKYYLDCIRAASSPEREYRYRTTFIKRDVHADASQYPVVLSVNGQKLTTSLNIDKSRANYIFRYIDGELLNVTCQKRDVNMRGSLIFTADRMNLTLRSNPSEAVISLNASDIQNKSLICSINNTNAEAKLFFLSDVPGKDVRIRGLPRNNILYQYTNDLNQWTIEYQYSVNDTLDLTCVWNEGFNISTPLSRYANPFQWYFVDESFDSAATAMRNKQIKFSDQPLIRILNTTHIGTKIKCTYFFPNGKNDYNSSKTVEIILRLKPELLSEAKKDEVTLDTTDNNSMNMIVLIALGVGSAVAIITMVCLVSWRKRTKRANLIENAYDNLSNQNDSPIPPFPSQWEDNYDDPNYAKIVEEAMQENCYSTDSDKLCRMPDKRRSYTSENHYTEIDDYPKPKPDGLAARNTARQSNYNKQTDTPKATPSHSSNNACFNNFSDSKQGTYDKLRDSDLPINNSNENYSKVPKPSKNVIFRQMSYDLRPERNYSEGNSRQDGRNKDSNVKPNNDGHYANTGQDNIYMQPGKPIYQKKFLQNEKTDKPLDSDYAEPYDELGISCKNDFYG